MRSFNRKRISIVAIYLLLVFVTQAQPGCPAINPGNNVSLPCGTNCTTLRATPFDAGSTASYSVAQIPYTPFAYTGGTVVSANTDDVWSAPIQLPFNFCFFDSVYTQVLIGSNSEISFNLANYSLFSNFNPWSISGPVPNAANDTFSQINNSIMCPWEDIDPTNQGTISYEIIGTAPCRIFVCSWYQCGYYGDVNSVNASGDTDVALFATSQVAIYETTNVIEIYIQQKQQLDGWNGGLAIEGIENNAATVAYTVPGRNATNWNANNDAWRFTPNGPSIVNVSWYNGATQISTDSVVQVCPSTNTTYTAKAVYTPCAGGTPVTVTGTVTVSLAGSLDAGVDSSKNVSCFGLNNGALYAHATSANPPVTYGWADGSNLLTRTNLSPGTYVFTASDASGCTRRDTILITQPAQLTATVPNASETNCTGTGSGSLVAQPVGGNSPYAFHWNNGEAGVNDTLLNAGTYQVTVTDSLNCTASAQGTLTINIGASSVTLAQVALTEVSCFGGSNGSITVTAAHGSAPYAYLWSNTQSADSAVHLAAGPYTVSATDAGGCTATATFNITQPAQLGVTANVQNMTCGAHLTGAIAATVTGGTAAFTYNWTEVSNSQTFSGATINNLQPDTYTLTVTDAHNCQDSGSYTITQTPALTYVDSVGSTSCFGGNDGSAKISVTSTAAPFTFSWDYAGAPNDSVITNLPAGPVEVIVTDSNHCMVQVFLTIPQPTAVSVQLTSVTNVSCNGGSNGTISVSGTGGTPGYAFTWNNSVTGATDTGLIAGTYGVIATDTNGCTAAQSYTVTQPTALQINAPDIQNIGCSGGNTGSITANASNGTPAYTYNWMSEPGGQFYNGRTISNLAVGTYLLGVMDANGCVDTTSYVITAIPLLTFNVSTTPVSCFNGNNGTAHASITSGTPPYQFIWNAAPASTDSNTSNLTAGFLKLVVTDGNACLTDTTVSVIQPTPIVISQTGQTDVLCNGGNNGALVVSAAGGTPGYTYTWSNQFIGTNNINLPAGNYVVIVLDANNCADTAGYTIHQPTAVAANPTFINALCYGGADGSIDANPSGGTPAYNFLWSDGQTTQVAHNLVKGFYDCTVTDANGCTLIVTDTVGQPAKMVILDTTTAVKCIGQKSGTVTLSASGDTPPYSYDATNDNVNFIFATNGVIQGLDTGIYTVQISDSNGCVNTKQVYIGPAIPDEFYAPVIDSTLCYGPEYNEGSVLITDSTIQNGPYQYSIDGGALQDSGYFQNLSAGYHRVTYVNHNGCTDTIPVVVPQPLPIEAIVTPDTVTLPLGGSHAVLVTYLNATNPSFNWTNTLGFSCTDCPNPVVSGYAPGQYVVTVSMQNGVATCYGSTTLVVNVLPHTKSFVPNAFTPNGDGNNDVFLVYGEDIKTVSMRIFNRWGELVYETNNSLAGWDGTYKGQLQMPSVFSYEVTITYLDNTTDFKKGTVTLVR